MDRNETVTTEVIVYGAGGHAKVVIDALERSGRYAVRAVVDDDPAAAGRVLLDRYRVVSGTDPTLLQPARGTVAMVAIGSNPGRRRVFEGLQRQGFSFATAVHPAAAVAVDAVLAEGTVVMAGAVVNSDARIGRNVIVNTGARVDHDCRVADHVHLAPGSVLCGGVSIGEDALIGAGAVIIPGIRVGARATIGAGSTVLSDVEDDAIVAGSPARPVASRQ